MKKNSSEKINILINSMITEITYTVFQKKTGPFVISSYLCFDRYELHDNFQKYIGVVACCEYGMYV